MKLLLVLVFVWMTGVVRAKSPVALPPSGLFAATNLVAWCVVPFDARKRSPEQRAALLASLGFRRFAVDWRAEHVPTFDAEVSAARHHSIEITAWWFPSSWDDTAKTIAAVIERHGLHPQFWVMDGGDLGAKSDAERVPLEVRRLTPFAQEARRLGCQVALYNHLGWFGEPENQLKIIAGLNAAGFTNVGIVYNQHHGHVHLDRFAALLDVMKPHLLALNLNGMIPGGDAAGQKIVPLAGGPRDTDLLRIIRDSGWAGPIGIIGHTDDDVELRLRDNLAGLAWITERLAGRYPEAAPAFRTWKAPVTETRSSAGTPAVSGRDPGTQLEKDWADNRWQDSDVGQFLASALPLPGRTVPKGLSVKVGPNSEAAIAYDTGTMTFLGGWTGGFLRFGTARFGLLDAPRPVGSLRFQAPPGPAWTGAKARFVALHRHKARVVLEATIDGGTILEMPWADPTPAGVVLFRDLEIAPHSGELALALAAVPDGITVTEESSPAEPGSRHRFKWLHNGSLRIVTVRTDGACELRRRSDQVSLRLAPAKARTLLGIALWEGEPARATEYLAWEEKNFSLMELKPFTATEPARTTEGLVTQGQLGPAKDFLAVDALPLPYDNPWHALLFASGIDFTPDGTGYLCTMHGDVWQVGGIDDSLSRLTWRRFATGLFQPLGLKARGGEIFVLGRDRITRLRDRNGDGEADLYENFFDGIDTSAGGHDYVTCLETDSVGNFYYVDPTGVHRVAADGSTKTMLASGFRNPNGMGVSPTGDVVTVAPQQGEWTPSSELIEVRGGGWYGYGGPRDGVNAPLGRDWPLCWIPHGVDNSSGSQAWLPSAGWGPLGGGMIHLLWGRCGAMLALRDVSAKPVQGAMVPLPVKFLAGPNRASIHPRDGHLYVAGSTGWQTSAVRDGALQRVRFTGQPVTVPVAWRQDGTALEFTFGTTLDAGTAADAGSFALKRWNYRYAADYGSRDWSVTHPNREGRDDVAVPKASLLADRKTVRIEAQDLTPAMQYELKYNLSAADGAAMRGSVWFSIHPRGAESARR
jgi:hypothetical protein